MARRMSRNDSRGTATSAIWKITCRACLSFHPLDSLFFVVSTWNKAFVYAASIALICDANLGNPGLDTSASEGGRKLLTSGLIHTWTFPYKIRGTRPAVEKHIQDGDAVYELAESLLVGLVA